MTLATHVLNWQNDDDLNAEDDTPFDTDSDGKPFVFELLPGSPDVNEEFVARLTSPVAESWHLRHISDVSGSLVGGGQVFSGEPAQEVVLLSDAAINTRYPVLSCASVHAQTPLFSDDDATTLIPAGHSASPYAVVNHALSLHDANETGWLENGAHGVVDVDYTTVQRKQWAVSGLAPGIHFFVAYISGSHTVKIIQLDLSGADDDNGDELTDEGQLLARQPFVLDVWVAPESNDEEPGSSPKPGQPFELRLYASNADQWQGLKSSVGSGGEILNTATHAEEHFYNPILLSGGASLIDHDGDDETDAITQMSVSTDYPASSVAEVSTKTGIYSADDFAEIVPPGSTITDTFSIDNNQVVWNDEQVTDSLKRGVIGSIGVSYLTVPHKRFLIDALQPDFAYLFIVYDSISKRYAVKLFDFTVEGSFEDEVDDDVNDGIPFKIEVEPYAPDPMQRYTVRLFAKDAHEWILEHKGAASGGEIEEVKNKAGLLFSDKSDEDFETLSLFDSDALSTAYPIASISSAITPTGLIDNLFEFVVSPGGSMSSQLSVIDNQLQLVADGKHYGQIEIDYTTTPYKEWTCKGATRGLQYYRASILKDNVFREKHIAVDIGNTQGLEDVEDTGVENGIPFKIEVKPSNPVENESVVLRLYARDCGQWTLAHYSNSAGGQIGSVSIHVGDHIKDELVSVSDSQASASYPIESINHADSSSGFFDVESGSHRSTPPTLTVVDNAVQMEGSYSGLMTLDYTTTQYKQFAVSGMKAGGHLFVFQKGEQIRIETLTIQPVSLPFKFIMEPSQPIEGEEVFVSLYAEDALTFSLSLSADVTVLANQAFLSASAGGVILYAGETVSSEVVSFSGRFGSTEYPVHHFSRSSITDSTLIHSETGDPLDKGVIISGFVPLAELNNQLVLPDAYSGTLTLGYSSTHARKWKSTGLPAGSYTLMVRADDGRQHVEQFTIEQAGITQQTLQIRDYCTDEPVPNASITIDGVAYTADAQGYVVLGEMATGQTLPMTITAAGYHDTGVDTLNNDELNT